MSGKPPKGTLILNDSFKTKSVVGIDTQFFTVSDVLKGIKLISNGVHLLHFSDSVTTGDSIRLGWWFQCGDGEVLEFKRDDTGAHFIRHECLGSDFGDAYQCMLDYSKNSNAWQKLSQFIDMEAVEEFVPNLSSPISTATPSAEENIVLLSILKEKQPKAVFSCPEDDELKYTIIQMQKKRENRVENGSDITQDALEKSWYLNELYGNDHELLLAELQFSFILFIILGNMCSYTQWMNVLLLLSKSRSFLRSERTFASSFKAVLEAQLEILPTEYVLQTSSSTVVETNKLLEVFTGLGDVWDPNEYNKTKTLLQKKFGVELRLPSQFDHNNFEIYDLDDHDPDDEDAPAVVL